MEIVEVYFKSAVFIFYGNVTEEVLTCEGLILLYSGILGDVLDYNSVRYPLKPLIFHYTQKPILFAF